MSNDPRPEPSITPTPLDHAPAPQGPSMTSRLLAEAFGTFLLVFASIGAALFAANFGGDGNPLGIGFVGVSLAFGLTVMACAYAWGPISGGHFNPAVTLGLAAAGRFEWRDTVPYIIAQAIGGAVGTTLLVLIGLFGPDGWLTAAQDGGFASNGFGELSPGKYSMLAVLVCEIVMTAVFLFVIMGATDARAPAGFAPIAIGLCLTLIHLVSIPVSNTSVNPARSSGVALFAQTGALSQLWLFWVAPIVGGMIGAVVYKAVAGARD